MVTVPAFVWRHGAVVRGLILGLGVGGLFGALAWLDSGLLLGGLVACAVLTVFYGGWMARRMTRYWPRAGQLSGSDRESVVGAARRGERLDDTRLTTALLEYRDGLAQACEEAKPLRWVLRFVLVVAVGMAVWDAIFGSWGNAVASVVYLVILVLEMFCWPRRQRQLLESVDRAAELSRSIETGVE